MDYKTVTLDEIIVVGIATRTTNEKNKATKDIKALWDKFYMDRVMYTISQKTDESVITLYTSYEKDHTKPYTVVLGYKVDNIDTLPQGMVYATIPKSKYAVFHIKGENIVNELIKIWKYIWNSDLQRTYTGDFEVYIPPDGHEADIYVAIK